NREATVLLEPSRGRAPQRLLDRGGRRRRGRRLRLSAGLRLPLHVDAAAEVRTVGNRDPRRHQVAVDRPVVADVDALARGDVALHFALHDDDLGEDLRLDLAVGPDRQHVVAELDLAFDLALDREVLAAGQVTLDDDALADVHGALLLSHCVGPRRLLGGGNGAGCCWLRRSDGLVTLPHVSLLQAGKTPGDSRTGVLTRPAGWSRGRDPRRTAAPSRVTTVYRQVREGTYRTHCRPRLSGVPVGRVTCCGRRTMPADAQCYHGLMRIYLDYNATAPPLPEVVEAVSQAMAGSPGNASSVHTFGQQAKAALDTARTEVARLLGAEASEIVFTSGGTEADNLAIRGAAEALEQAGRRHLVTTAIEHEAVLNTMRALERRG